VDYWIGKGAKPSDTLHSIIKRYRRGLTGAPAPVFVAKAAPAEAAPAPAAAS
jgi:ribosomal protein S16